MISIYLRYFFWFVGRIDSSHFGSLKKISRIVEKVFFKISQSHNVWTLLLWNKSSCFLYLLMIIMRSSSHISKETVSTVWEGYFQKTYRTYGRFAHMPFRSWAIGLWKVLCCHLCGSTEILVDSSSFSLVHSIQNLECFGSYLVETLWLTVYSEWILSFILYGRTLLFQI